MSDPIAADIEGLLRQAFRPVEPPESLSVRLESTLQELTDLAAEELESWELSAMRDPRNWVRPVAAVAIGTAAGAGLVVLRVRPQHRKQRKHVQGIELAERTVKAAADEVKRLVDRF
jgi:H+/Cl- antiporter ClcA